jgi:nucleoside-diphosphate-sugar epimerase
METTSTIRPQLEPQPTAAPHATRHGAAVLVTGSSGLIGSRLCERLASKYSVIGLDLKPSAHATRGVTFIECDLTREESVQQAVGRIRAREDLRIASVVHLAAHYDFSGQPSPLYEELTVKGTQRLLGALQDLPIEQFVFASTLLVMKPADPDQRDPDLWIDETSPVEATWDYPRSKLAAEDVIRRLHGEIPAVVLRIAGVYDEDTHSIPLAQQMHRIREKTFESYFFPGNPERGQPFVHLDDLMDAFERVIEARNLLAPDEVFLIAEPDVVTYSELQDILGEAIHGKEWPTIRIPAPLAKAGAWLKDKLSPRQDTFIKPWMIDLADAHYPVSIERAQRLLSWAPHHRLRNTLAQMAARLEQDPTRWYESNGLKLPEDAEVSRRARASSP